MNEKLFGPIEMYVDTSHGLMLKFAQGGVRRATDEEKAKMLAALATKPGPSEAIGARTREAWQPFADFMSTPLFEKLSNETRLTAGSPMARKQLTVGHLRNLADAILSLSGPTREETSDTLLLDWLEHEDNPVETIYLDDGTLIDFGGVRSRQDLRTTIREAMEKSATLSRPERGDAA